MVKTCSYHQHAKTLLPLRFCCVSAATTPYPPLSVCFVNIILISCVLGSDGTLGIHWLSWHILEPLLLKRSLSLHCLFAINFILFQFNARSSSIFDYLVLCLSCSRPAYTTQVFPGMRPRSSAVSTSDDLKPTVFNGGESVTRQWSFSIFFSSLTDRTTRLWRQTLISCLSRFQVRTLWGGYGQ